jgi:signal transduction histidine kinase/DNA-binding LacI/PurR family transcriptional regulator/AraC-like DNA-binding protein
MAHPLTIGFISAWEVYQGTTIDRYAHSLMQGISDAAHELKCNLLFGCGFSATGNSRFGPIPGLGMSFLPVGPWNTDGLIIVSDEMTGQQHEYVHSLISTGFPIIFTTPEGPGPSVTVDNASGIRQAFSHLLEHGHRQIAFIAGSRSHKGDSDERLCAYKNEVERAGISFDEQLVAFGAHSEEGGEAAMQQIIKSGSPFSAVIASNDFSCLGAMRALTNAGFHIPDDIAVIGFDDILDARSHSPSLTSVRHPTFALGYQAVLSLVDCIRGVRKYGDNTRIVVPPRLIIRQSCGCFPGYHTRQYINSSISNLGHEMAEDAMIDAHNSLLDDLETQNKLFLDAFLKSLQSQKPDLMVDAIKRGLSWAEEHGEDAHIWQASTSTLLKHIDLILSQFTEINPSFVFNLLDRARQEVNDEIQRRTTRAMLAQMDMMAQLGQFTAEMLSVMDVQQTTEVLSRHLPKLGVRQAIIALYEPDGEDAASKARVIFESGVPSKVYRKLFDPRRFPGPEIYPTDHPLQLIILPLDIDEKTGGFVALEASNPEVCAAITLNLAVALRTSRLYQDAVAGRKQAEEAAHLKSRFLSMVSHELRTPLSLIVGLSDMALKGEGIEKRDIEQINTSAQHLAHLIGDVLDLASSEAGQLRILREPLDLAEVFNVTTRIGEEMAHQKGLAFHAILPARSPWILGDRTRLRQVVLNLLTNAVKFTPAGQIRLEVVVEQNHVSIMVSDTGIGITPTEITSIFDEFTRSERANEIHAEGLGLGLAITKELVQQHGGKIEVQSPGMLGSGSTFTLTLPVISIHGSPSLFSNSPSYRSDAIMILAESGDSTEFLTGYLVQQGFSVHQCWFEQETDWFSKVTELSPSALILSEHLAGHEGWAIAGILKRHPATEPIPILTYALDIGNNQGELFELSYLHKPLQLGKLAHELKHFLPSSAQSQTILVVDDDPAILEMNARLVEQTGRSAITARNGREALMILEKTRPDLILLDLVMPEMDGFTVLDTLHTREATRDIPVIIFTARTLSDADLERCNRGVASILGKGLFSTAETLTHIEAALLRQNTLGGATRQLMRQAMAYIHTHYAEELTREEIAAHISISPDYLTDCFRQELGITPNVYLRRYRIRQACEFLRNTDQTITQIAQNVGFSDGAYFTHAFLREIGITPKAYRRNR